MACFILCACWAASITWAMYLKVHRSYWCTVRSTSAISACLVGSSLSLATATCLSLSRRLLQAVRCRQPPDLGFALGLRLDTRSSANTGECVVAQSSSLCSTTVPLACAQWLSWSCTCSANASCVVGSSNASGSETNLSSA